MRGEPVHPEALEAVRRMVNTSGYISSKPNPPGSERIAIDIGGADVNGSARALIPGVDRWYGLDIAEGEGVDLIADATDDTVMSAYHELFDVVLCTEVLEHVADWSSVVRNAWTVLSPDGFAFFTFAGTNGRTWARRPHGARGEHDVPNGEHYANVPLHDFQAVVADTVVLVNHFEVMVRPNPGDIYCWFRK